MEELEQGKEQIDSVYAHEMRESSRIDGLGNRKTCAVHVLPENNRLNVHVVPRPDVRRKTRASIDGDMLCYAHTRYGRDTQAYSTYTRAQV